MRCLLQRVARAEVRVDGVSVGRIARGYLALVGVFTGDTDGDRDWLAKKLIALRVFEDSDGKMNRAIADVGGSILAVSQFTLCADTRRGNRPSFTDAMPPEQAAPMFDAFVHALRAAVPVETGRFGAHMEVELVNDGPVTLLLDSRQRS